MKTKIFKIAKSPIGDLIVGIAFGKFSNLLPIKRIRETDRVVAFWHPKPSWEKHILLVLKKSIKNLSSITEDDSEYIFEIYMLTKQIIEELELDKDNYTLLTNGGNRQKVNQLHFHLISGKQL